MTLIAAAHDNLAALAEELDSTPLVFAAYGVEVNEVEELAHTCAKDTGDLLMRRLTDSTDKEGTVLTDLMALYSAGVCLGLAIAREIEHGTETHIPSPEEG